MKKIILSIGLIAIIAIGAFTLVACDDIPSTIEQFAGITPEQAKQIAIENLGITVEDVQQFNAERENKNGTQVYDIELQVEGVKYEYRIDANNGTVRQLEINDQTVPVTQVPITPVVAPATTYIGIEAAKTAALNDLVTAGVDTTGAVFTEAKLDFDDGMYLYELEFNIANVEYDYEIKATDGTVYKKEIDSHVVVEPTPSTGASYVGVETAKATALRDAGIDAANATFVKAKFEVDNGVHVYDIEFTAAGVEYEYEINATTGIIITKEIDGAVPNVSGNDIGLDAAKAEALKHAGVNSADAVFTEAKRDVEHGIYVYEIEFTANGFEYEYEINASTGAVIDVDKERI